MGTLRRLRTGITEVNLVPKGGGGEGEYSRESAVGTDSIDSTESNKEVRDAVH